MREMKCKRCGANENRIHGFCSMECETAWEYEDEIRDLTTRIDELEKDNDEFRQLIRDWSIVLDQNCDFELWQVESVRQAMLEINKEREE